MSIPAIDRVAPATPRRRDARRAWASVTLAFSAMVAGSRTIPLGDNGDVVRDLAARAGASQVDDFDVVR